jgi:broad specificity phosphatase PhoE
MIMSADSHDDDARGMKLFLIRHGETEWSLSGRHTGTTEVPLTERGEAGARELGESIRAITFARVFCSPRLRARRTCELLGLTPRPEFRDELAEWNYGDYEGLRTAEIRARKSDWNIWLDGCPKGESPSEVAARADRFLDEIEKLSGNVAIVSHGHFTCALIVRWAHLAIGAGQHFVIDPAALSVLGTAKHQPEIRTIDLANALPGSLSTRYGNVPTAIASD